MGRSFTPVPRLVPLCLLVTVSVVCLPGNSAAGDHGLQCVTDYVLINCSLNLPASSANASYWLHLLETSVYRETYVCDLTDASGPASCSVRKPAAEDYPDILTDMHVFEISLCHKQPGEAGTCEVLNKDFRPVYNIKPNAPCCLTVGHNSSQHRFIWRSTYERYSDDTELVDNFNFQLHFYKREDQLLSHTISTDSTEYSVDDQEFEPDSDYAARVRSSPNQEFYQGQWSDWSSEVHWKTEPATGDASTTTVVSDLAKRVFIPLSVPCLLVLLVLLLCRAPFKMWKQSAFIPNPAPYFHTLYSTCQGDFGSWVVTQGDAADMVTAEETLQIDTLIKTTDVPGEDRQAPCSHQLMDGYGNIPGHMCDGSPLGFPYAVSSPAPLSHPESVRVRSGNPAEGDSGCWLCSNTSLEKDPPWYCNDYCTLSSFQQLTLVTAEHLGSPRAMGIRPVSVSTSAE